ncbi:tetratricopeptide repeat protein [Patescibacteria group bacterium]|nr:tetratricopeptide repeat protein [Patescibacteria group bacterium]MBU1931839.1 tetratricopeptide repeat protein [Patescibacteria group bacterium]
MFKTNSTPALSKIINWGIVGLSFTLPLFFLLFTADVFFFNKFSLLIAGTLILSALCVVNSLKNKRFTFTLGVFDLPIIALAASNLLSLLLRTPNKSAALIGEAGVILGLTVFYFLVSNQLKKNWKPALTALVISAGLLSLVTLYQFIGVGEAFFSNTIFAAKSFTPAGNLLTLVSFLIISLILTLRLALTNKLVFNKTMLFVAAGIQVSALILGIYQMFPGQTAALRLLPFSAGWQIAIYAFKQSPLWGVGPNNFLSAFTLHKPLSLNFGDLWTMRFLQSSNYPLQLLTTLGLFGLISWLLLVLVVIKNFKKHSQSKQNKTLLWVIIASLALQFLAPTNILNLFVLYLSLGILGRKTGKTVSWNQPQNNHLDWLIHAVGGALIMIMLTPLYFLGRSYAAEYYFKASLKAAARNDGSATYKLQLKALGLNPRLMNLKIAFSQTNLALAQSLANRTNPSDQDRQNIVQLIQQAIAEAKQAVTINPENIIAWENLALIYRNLINFAEGADQWALAAFTQAVKLDPGNVNLRIQLGGLYHALQDYDSAQRVFEQAITVKPNYANAYYNLAVTLQEQNKLEKAALAYRQTLNLLPADSSERAAVETRLAPIEEHFRQAAEEAKTKEVSAQTLTEPEPVPQKPSGFEPIILDEEKAAPPTPKEATEAAKPTE